MKPLKIIKWILFTIAYGYSLINVIIFVMALMVNCVNWNSESIVAELLKLLVCLFIVILWHIDINISYYYEKSLENDSKEIDNKFNHIVRLQNRIDEYKNFEWLVVNKKISMFYISLSATHDRYNEYVTKEEQKLTKEEFHLVKNIYCEFIEVEECN